MPHGSTFRLATVFGAVTLLSIAVSSAQQPPAPPPAILRDYQPVTAERLKNPEDGNWLMIRRTYDGAAFSPLTEITSDNVKRLRVVAYGGAEYEFGEYNDAAYAQAVRDGAAEAPILGSLRVRIFSSATGAEKLGQPVPESNFAAELNSGLPQQMQRKSPESWI